MSWDRFNDQFRETHDETQDRWRATTARRKAEGKCWQCAKLIVECKCPNVNHPPTGAVKITRLLAAAGWDAGSIRHKQLEDALDGANLEIVERRFINCEACQTEGRILTSDGGPDDVDHGACPECNGERVVEVECDLITMEDLDVRSTRD